MVKELVNSYYLLKDFWRGYVSNSLPSSLNHLPLGHCNSYIPPLTFFYHSHTYYSLFTYCFFIYKTWAESTFTRLPFSNSHCDLATLTFAVRSWWHFHWIRTGSLWELSTVAGLTGFHTPSSESLKDATTTVFQKWETEVPLKAHKSWKSCFIMVNPRLLWL